MVQNRTHVLFCQEVLRLVIVMMGRSFARYQFEAVFPAIAGKTRAHAVRPYTLG